MSDHSSIKDNLIIESQYFGCVNYINTLFIFSDAKIDVYESFQKMSFRNRCVVAGSNGLIHLSVPLEKGRAQKQLIRDVRISYTERWQLQHWRTLESCYSRSPFYEFYRDGLEGFFLKEFTFLTDLNMALLDWLRRQLKFTASISTTDTYLADYPTGTTDLRNRWLPKNFQEGGGETYTQVFADKIGFQPNLCILDLLFCCGPAINPPLSILGL